MQIVKITKDNLAKITLDVFYGIVRKRDHGIHWEDEFDLIVMKPDEMHKENVLLCLFLAFEEKYIRLLTDCIPDKLESSNSLSTYEIIASEFHTSFRKYDCIQICKGNLDMAIWHSLHESRLFFRVLEGICKIYDKQKEEITC